MASPKYFRSYGAYREYLKFYLLRLRTEIPEKKSFMDSFFRGILPFEWP